MGKFKEYLKKNTFKDTFGDVFKGYDLKQCVLMSKKVSKHSGKVYTVGCLGMILILLPFCIANEILKAINGAEGALFGPHNPDMLTLLMCALCVFCLAGGYCFSMSYFEIMIKKRINEIAGVTDNGEEEKGTD